jgi:hypothetical protein
MLFCVIAAKARKCISGWFDNLPPNNINEIHSTPHSSDSISDRKERDQHRVSSWAGFLNFTALEEIGVISQAQPDVTEWYCFRSCGFSFQNHDNSRAIILNEFLEGVSLIPIGDPAVCQLQYQAPRFRVGHRPRKYLCLMILAEANNSVFCPSAPLHSRYCQCPLDRPVEKVAEWPKGSLTLMRSRRLSCRRSNRF